ncbi:hypothetical protein ccbrp13_03140 [Ktedonobacteria bacterium brp13]|nr:hypothetical protein ccbrp13_03140 [Ktedonobacteria bacterium brp13]
MLWGGQAISSIGGGISQLAFPFLLLAITGSPLSAAIAGALNAFPRVFIGISNPIGQILTGLLLQYQNSAVTVIAGSLIMALVATGFMLDSHVRQARMPVSA